MNFINIQVIIFVSIILFSILGGKKLSLIASLVWIIETIFTYRISKINYLQIITVTMSFQIGIIVAIIRDFIVKRIKKIKEWFQNNYNLQVI